MNGSNESNGSNRINPVVSRMDRMNGSNVKMLSSGSLQRSTVKSTAHPVEITQGDLIDFHQLNPDEARVREEADKLRMTHQEYRDFQSDEALVVNAKVKHLSRMTKYIHAFTGIVTTFALPLPKDNPVHIATAAVRDNAKDIAQYALPYIPPDYTLDTPGSRPEDKKVIVSEARGPKVSALLRSFTVPEGVAKDAEDIYENGPSLPVFVSLASQVANHYLPIKEEEKHDAGNFAFDDDE